VEKLGRGGLSTTGNMERGKKIDYEHKKQTSRGINKDPNIRKDGVKVVNLGHGEHLTGDRKDGKLRRKKR